MGNIYVVATPIGNLEDISFRAIKTLKEVDLIACEDTRVTKKLLDKFEIVGKKLVSLHQHSKENKVSSLLNFVKDDLDVAVTTDAGTPGVADPAAQIVNQAFKENIRVIPIPGASALTSLLSVTGIKDNQFVFLGFLPKKKGRKTLFDKIKNGIYEDLPLIVFESPYRIVRTLTDFAKIDNYNVVVGRELTKKFEQIIKGNIQEVIEYLNKNKHKVKGEFSVCLVKPE